MRFDLESLRRLRGIYSTFRSGNLHGQFTCGIGDGIDLHGEARTLRDVRVGNQVNVEKASVR